MALFLCLLLAPFPIWLGFKLLPYFSSPLFYVDRLQQVHFLIGNAQKVFLAYIGHILNSYLEVIFSTAALWEMLQPERVFFKLKNSALSIFEEELDAIMNEVDYTGWSNVSLIVKNRTYYLFKKEAEIFLESLIDEITRFPEQHINYQRLTAKTQSQNNYFAQKVFSQLISNLSITNKQPSHILSLSFFPMITLFFNQGTIAIILSVALSIALSSMYFGAYYIKDKRLKKNNGFSSILLRQNISLESIINDVLNQNSLKIQYILEKSGRKMHQRLKNNLLSHAYSENLLHNIQQCLKRVLINVCHDADFNQECILMLEKKKNNEQCKKETLFTARLLTNLYFNQYIKYHLVLLMNASLVFSVYFLINYFKRT